MRYFDAFTGIGGFTLGIQQAYESLCDADRSEDRRSQEDTERNKRSRLLPQKGQDLGPKERPDSQCYHNLSNERPLCVGYSEIDKYASEIYSKHFPEHTNYGDITKINAEQLPDFDCLVGGFPCQSFSVAGKRRGFEDTRGTVFFELARILQAKRPRLFVFENVKGLLSHDNGKTFAVITQTLTDLGYDLQWQVLNSKDFGVPQNRERVFIIGYIRGTCRLEIFPIGISPKKDLRRVGEEISYCLDANYAKGTNTIEKGRRQIVQLARGFNRGGEHDIAPTLSTNAWSYNNPLRDIQLIRRLTPLECERLQGFPDNWTEGISDTQRYKCCGNAVTVNVIECIFKKILPYI